MIPLRSSGPKPGALDRLGDWLNQRVGTTGLWEAFFIRRIPLGVGWLYTLGFTSMFLFIIQVVTGMFLAMYYSPSPDHAYDSIQFITYEVPFGAVVRGIHHWGASAMVVLVVAHMVAVFVLGAYKYPRELTWMVGVGLLLLTFVFGFTGYLLPWDEKAYWATVVGSSIPGTLPAVGDFFLRVGRGGAQLGALTLTRFFALHTMVLPSLLAGLLGIHLYLIVHHGVSVPPGLWERTPEPLRGLLGSRQAATGSELSPEEEYHGRYEAFKERGHPFWPNIIVEDAIAAGLVMIAIIGFMIGLGIPTEARADPTNTAYSPKPEWYFLFLFQFIKYFPGSLEWVATVLIPAAVILLILFLPLYDRSPWRSPTRRPVAMAVGFVMLGILAYLTYAAY